MYYPTTLVNIQFEQVEVILFLLVVNINKAKLPTDH